ncbi:MAG: methyltransferase domain-containing protein, partial [Selenomonas artemidis]
MAEKDWKDLNRETAEGNPRRPEGAAGRAMLTRMNESHAKLTAWGLSLLSFVPNDTVLDVGCGGGNTLARMAERVTAGHLVGIDYSETSVEASRAFNSALVAS